MSEVSNEMITRLMTELREGQRRLDEKMELVLQANSHFANEIITLKREMLDLRAEARDTTH